MHYHTWYFLRHNRYCCSLLQPATGIPNIFADDNNIQIYLSSLALFTGTY